MDQF